MPKETSAALRFFKPKRRAVTFHEVTANGLCLGLVKYDEVNVVISRDKFSVQPESLILAQNERWRQA